MKTEKVRGLKSIQSLKGLKINQEFLLISPQFNVANRIKLAKFDETGLDRDLAYFQYVEDPKETESFCIWQHDLINNVSVLFPYIF